MSINGMDEWLKKIESLKTDFPQETGRFLQKKANEVIRETKKLTPVDTGTLRNSWQRKNGGSFRQIVYSSVSYSQFVEFGHRIIRKKRVVGIVRGRHMLHKGINRVRMTFYRDLETMYKNLISR